MYDPNLKIETARLLLRQPRLAELEDWVACMSVEENMRYIGGVQPRLLVWRMLMASIGAWSAQGFSMFSVLDRHSGAWLGRVGPHLPDGWPGPEVGWSLRHECWHQGYAAEAATAAIDWAFEHLHWSGVIHCIAPDNAPSQAVARRLGSVNQGPGALPAPHAHAAIDIWGQSRALWRARRTATALPP